MEKSATLNLRVNPTLKQDAESVLGRLGIPMSTAPVVAVFGDREGKVKSHAEVIVR